MCLPSHDRKLAKKRKDAIGTTRQEMTHMVNAMDRSYADQSTLHGEDPMAVTFMDSHNYNNRCRFTNRINITMITFNVETCSALGHVRILVSYFLILLLLLNGFVCFG